MIDAGYFAKSVAPKPDWLGAAAVREICSVSNCISSPPEDWVYRWLHNDLGWFNTISDACAVVPADQRADFRLFAYRIYPEIFRAGARHVLVVASDVHPESIPRTFEPIGFDSVSKFMESILGFQCSPLSCNSLATEMDTNEYCLFHSLDAAIAGATRFSIEQPEPGDYYVVEVLERHPTT
jgi:hypothetical protein